MDKRMGWKRCQLLMDSGLHKVADCAWCRHIEETVLQDPMLAHVRQEVLREAAQARRESASRPYVTPAEEV